MCDYHGLSTVLHTETMTMSKINKTPVLVNVTFKRKEILRIKKIHAVISSK